MILKPCPHCGSDGTHYPDGDMEGYAILCSGNRDHNRQCARSRFAYETAQEAEEAWNRRHTELEVGMVRYIGQMPTPEQQYRARASDLYKLGDCILVWVLQRDILSGGIDLEAVKPFGATIAEYVSVET